VRVVGSVQDNSVLHVSDRGPTLVADDVTVGHGAVFESCEIERGALIGMNAVILHNAVIGEESLVAALSVVPERMQVPARTLVAGAPARVRRELTPESVTLLHESAEHYVQLSRSYLDEERSGGLDAELLRRAGSDRGAPGARDRG
jgi:carbonic anhydrase/acetyltransferase-like protein (isoleucine patch superfamily)